MERFEQNLHINDSSFEGMRSDADRVLQKLLKNMVEKESLEGSLTIKIDVTLKEDIIKNTNPQIEGETRKVLSPVFTHKIGSMMQIKDEAKGGINYDGMEMVWDDELKEYVIKPIADTEQMSFFDADFQEIYEEAEEREYEQPALEGRRISALPGPSIEESEKSEENITEDVPCGDTEGTDSNDTDESENDLSDVMFSEEYDDGYEYEEPGEEE